MNWEKLAPLRTLMLVLLGFVSISVGAFLWLIPVGYVVLGVGLVLLAYLTDTGQVRR